MSLIDKFLDAIRVKDDYDEEDEFLDDDDLEEEDEADEEETPRRRFFRKIEEEPEEEAPARKSFFGRRRDTEEPSEEPSHEKKRVSQNKVTPMRKRSTGENMEVCVIKPSSMEDTRDIANTLLNNCTVVLNLEGIDVEVAQRVIDFSCGACFAINGNLQMVSSYIFILTPSAVEISGDIQDILRGATNAPAMRSQF